MTFALSEVRGVFDYAVMQPVLVTVIQVQEKVIYELKIGRIWNYKVTKFN
jgi:hypothetical protein